MAKVTGFPKLAAITCGTLLLSSVAVSEAQAVTLSQTNEFNIVALAGTSTTSNIGFDLFDPTLGTLTAVSFDLDSAVQRNNDQTVIASLNISGNELASYTTVDFNVDEPFDFTGLSGLIGGLTLGSYTGPGVFNVDATLDATNAPDPFPGTDGIWNGSTPYAGLTLTYTYDAAVVPVPAAVWLFGSGLLGFIGIARRKQAA